MPPFGYLFLISSSSCSSAKLRDFQSPVKSPLVWCEASFYHVVACFWWHFSVQVTSRTFGCISRLLLGSTTAFSSSSYRHQHSPSVPPALWRAALSWSHQTGHRDFLTEMLGLRCSQTLLINIPNLFYSEKELWSPHWTQQALSRFCSGLEFVLEKKHERRGELQVKDSRK